jgi:hypothetical protein
MVTPRAIRGMLRNFLGTYTSQYSDYKGYWLFGFPSWAMRSRPKGS